jgi:four helix bundle protein
MTFRFEGLEIWHRARDFSAKIHEVTVKFPRPELYGLTDQINRASDAVSLLIAEGSGLQTNALFSHRLGLAVGETFEVVPGA